MRRGRQRGWLGAAAAVALAPGMAAAAEVDHAQQYRACVALTYRAPWDAYEAAQAWQAVGGGAPALHCAALALLEAKQYERSAQLLESLAARLPPENRPSPVDLLAQAANVWLLAGAAAQARQAIDAAVQGEPDNPVLLVDRARVLAELADYAGALADLDRAVALDPVDGDAAAFRASALRHLGRHDEALAAAERALTLAPDNPSARLERGLVRQALGDEAGARADWVQVAREHGGTPAADAARDYLERLDLKDGG